MDKPGTSADPDPDLPVLIRGYAAADLPGLGAEPARIGPLAKINFLVGRNNHGKSTLLRASQLFAGAGVDQDYVARALPDNSLWQPGPARRQSLVVLAEAGWPDDGPARSTAWPEFLRIADMNGVGTPRGDDLHVWVELEHDARGAPDATRLNIEAWFGALGLRPAADDLVALLHPARQWTAPADRPATLSERLCRRGPPAWARAPAFREIRPAAPDPRPGDPDAGTGLIARARSPAIPPAPMRPAENCRAPSRRRPWTARRPARAAGRLSRQSPA